MRHAALFAGIGGFIYGAKNENVETVWANEVDEKCCDFLELNFPDVVVLRKSIAEINKQDIDNLPGEIDILSAGFPCQSFSGAGGELKLFDDPRGKLFFDIPRIIGLMKDPPKVVLLENVPLIKTLDDGGVLKTILTEMKFAGYWVKENQAEILNSAEYGSTPQRRERIFIVCAHKKYFTTNPFDFKKLEKVKTPNLFNFIDRSINPGDEYYLSPESKYYKMISALVKNDEKNRLFQIRRVEARACNPNYCPTLTASMGDGGHNVPFVFDDYGLRRLTEMECLKLQGFDTEKVKLPIYFKSRDILKMAGNAVSVNTVGTIISAIRLQLFSFKEN